MKTNLNSNKLAVLLIDMQDFFLKNFDTNIRKSLISNQLKIINHCVKNKIPVIVLEYKCKGVFRGATLVELSKKVESIVITPTIIKESNSGFTNTKLEQILKDKKCKKIVLMGINANGYVQDTAIGAIHRGYGVMTSKGVIASSSRHDMGLSKRNEEWYSKNGLLSESVADLLKEISEY